VVGNRHSGDKNLAAYEFLREKGIVIALRECREEDRVFAWEVRRQALREYVAAIWGWDEGAQREKFEQRFTPPGHQIIVVDGMDAGLLQVVDEGAYAGSAPGAAPDRGGV
jgi:hypothetical protein